MKKPLAVKRSRRRLKAYKRRIKKWFRDNWDKRVFKGKPKIIDDKWVGIGIHPPRRPMVRCS